LEKKATVPYDHGNEIRNEVSELIKKIKGKREYFGTCVKKKKIKQDILRLKDIIKELGKKKYFGPEITFDLEDEEKEPFYDFTKLSEKKLKELKKNGHHLYYHLGFSRGKQKIPVLLRDLPHNNPSNEHQSLVAHIYFYLKDYKVKNITLSRHKQDGLPDIAFDWKGKKYAIEVETGKNNKKDIEKKLRDKEKYDRFLIVVTKYHYSLKKVYLKHKFEVFTRVAMKKELDRIFSK